MTPSSSLPHATDAPSRTPFPSPSPSPEAVGGAGSRPGAREDLRSYADLGGFTLRAETHPWYAALEAIGSPEEARAASTVLAELRVRDLPAVREGAALLTDGTSLDEPGTAEQTRTAVALLLQVRGTLAVLSPAAYEEADLDALLAATASGAWRKEQGVTLSWTLRRSLRRRARALASARRTRRDALHTALAAMAKQRAEWAALAPGGGLPALPADSAFLDETARAAEAAAAGLRELGRLLSPERDLETVAFDELTELLARLASDEGTLYRLPTLRSLRDRLRQQGLTDLLAELTARRADGAEAVAAYDARNGGGAGETGEAREAEAVVDAGAEPQAVAEVAVDDGAEAEPVAGDSAPAAVAEESAADVVAVQPEPEPEPVAEDSVPAAVVEESAAVEEPAEEPEDGAVVAEAPAPEPVSVVEEPAADVVAVQPEAEPEAEAEPVAEDSAPAAAAEEPAAVEEPAAGKPEADGSSRVRRPRKPSITPGRPVTAYSAEELASLVRWLDGDGVERSDDELLRAAMKELGFARLGPRIKDALGAAVAEARG